MHFVTVKANSHPSSMPETKETHLHRETYVALTWLLYSSCDVNLKLWITNYQYYIMLKFVLNIKTVTKEKKLKHIRTVFVTDTLITRIWIKMGKRYTTLKILILKPTHLSSSVYKIFDIVIYLFITTVIYAIREVSWIYQSRMILRPSVSEDWQ